MFDGVGSSDLMRLLAACTRGSTPGIVADADDPFMRRPKIAQYIGSQCHAPADDSPRCTITGPQVVNRGRGGNCRARIFAFSENKVQLAKQALEDLKLVEHGKNTANNIINAILWSCITRVRLLRQTNHAALERKAKQSRLGLAVNGRSKVFGPEAARTSSYLGNMTFVATANMDVAQLDDVARTISYQQNPAVMAKNLESLVPLIGSLARAVDKIDISYIGQVFSGIEIVGDIDTLARPTVPGDVFCAYEDMNLNCSSWANMDLYGCDFGLTFSGKDQLIGTPVAVRFICDQSVDGAIMILPRRRMSPAGERIEIHVSLNEEDL